MKCPSHARIILASLVMTGLVACNQQLGGEDPLVRVDAAKAAMVDGDPIYIDEIELEAVAQGVIAPGEAFTRDHPKYQMILDQLIDQHLLAEEALRLRLDADPEARHRLKAARERILGNILVENLVALEVNERAIQDMYAEQVRLQQIDDQVRLSHILVNTKDVADQAYEELTNGAEFSATVFKYSIDAKTRMESGDLGYLSPNFLDEPFPTIIADTPTGQISKPFESAAGWHIIRVEDRRTAPPKTLEEMRPQIVTFMTYAEIARILKELRVAAVVEYPHGSPSPDADTIEPPGNPDPAPMPAEPIDDDTL